VSIDIDFIDAALIILALKQETSSMAKKIKVGYIGLGNIGKPSARHLIGDTYEAHVYDVYQPAVDEMVALGAVGCASPAELARACVHIGICVRDDKQVEELLYGEGSLPGTGLPGSGLPGTGLPGTGLLDNAARDTIIAIHSTVTQAGILKWAADAEAKNIKLIDAPITGGASGAEAATLCYMVGGDEATVAVATPVFETSADKVVHAGELGTGIILKLCNNLITYAEFMAMSEATRLAEAGGLSAEILREVGKSNGVINESMYQFASNRNALAASCTEQQMEEIFGPFGKLGEKDLECALQSASDLGISLPATARLRDDVYNLFMNKA
jgi:3-hydroxyisobutyrate dehydrogenase